MEQLVDIKPPSGADGAAGERHPAGKWVAKPIAALVVYRNAKDNRRGEELDKAVDEMGKRFIKKSRLETKLPTT